jgi:hypothetical protein
MKYLLFATVWSIAIICGCKSESKTKPAEAVPSIAGREPKGIEWAKDVPAKHDIINGWALTYQDEIYVLTGQEGRLAKYNPTTYQWVDLPGMPGPRKEFGATLWKDKIIVAGGVDDSSHFMRRVDYYDLQDKAWKFLASLPEPRSRFSLVAYDDILYATGGNCGPHEQNYKVCLDILAYNSEQGQWVVQTNLSSGRYNHLALHADHTMFLIGGYGYDQKLGSIYLNHAKKEFGFKPDLPEARGNLGGIVEGNFILTFGGKTKEAFSPMEKLDISKSQWMSLGHCPFWNDRFAFARWKDYVYVFGGSQSPKTVWKGAIQF